MCRTGNFCSLFTFLWDWLEWIMDCFELFWFATGLMRRWAKMQVKPQKPWTPEARVCECALLKEARSLCQHGKPGWECAWPQQGHQSQLERERRQDPEQSFTGVHANTVPSFMQNNWGWWNRMHAVYTVMVNTPTRKLFWQTQRGDWASLLRLNLWHENLVLKALSDGLKNPWIIKVWKYCYPISVAYDIRSGNGEVCSQWLCTSNSQKKKLSSGL